jgi:dTDP-4-dehydrorhamnose reductase
MTNNILIIGKNGQIANALIESFKLEKTGFNILVKDSSELDFSKPNALKENLKNISILINLIINCAGYTNVDKAEEEQELCDQINHQAVKILADFCKEKNIILIHYSTDYVFDGSGDKPFNEDNQENLQPLNYYGKTKLWSEQAIQNSGCDYIIFRISWIYDNRPTSKNFFNTIKKLALEKEEINVVDDQIGSPTSAEFVASNTIRFIKKITLENFNGNTGKNSIKFDKDLINQIYHLNNGELMSWHSFACKIVADLQKTSSAIILKKINKISSSKYKTKAIRGLNSRLNNKKFFGIIAKNNNLNN